MKNKCLLSLLFFLPVLPAATGFHAQGVAQAVATADFPSQLLNGSEDFNLAVDIYGDSRGNFGPCG